MNEFLERIKAKRTSNLVAAAVILALVVVDALAEHTLLSMLDEYIAAHSGPLADMLSHTGPWLIQHPLVLILLAVLVVGFNSFVLHDHAAHNEPAAPAPPVAPPTPVTVTTTQTANPSIHIHNYLQPAVPATQPAPQPVQRQIRPSDIAPNIVMQRPSVTRTDGSITDELHAVQGGYVTVKVCFHNRRTVGQPAIPFEYIRAHVSYRNASVIEVAFTDHPKWLGQDFNASMSIADNSTECMILALYGKDGGWYAPFLKPATLDDGSRGMDLDAQPLPFGEIIVEITLTNDYVALRPFVVRFTLQPDALVIIPD